MSLCILGRPETHNSSASASQALQLPPQPQFLPSTSSGRNCSPGRESECSSVLSPPRCPGSISPRAVLSTPSAGNKGDVSATDCISWMIEMLGGRGHTRFKNPTSSPGTRKRVIHSGVCAEKLRETHLECSWKMLIYYRSAPLLLKKVPQTEKDLN